MKSRGATVIVGIFLALTLVSVYVNFVHLETASKATMSEEIGPGLENPPGVATAVPEKLVPSTTSSKSSAAAKNLFEIIERRQRLYERSKAALSSSPAVTTDSVSAASSSSENPASAPSTPTPPPAPTATITPSSLSSITFYDGPGNLEHGVVIRGMNVSNLVVVWDFGACGCTGWAMECINIVMGLVKYIPKLSIIAGHKCFCPGIPKETLNVLYKMQEDKLQYWDIDVFVSHKPPQRYPDFPYQGVVNLDRRPKVHVGRSMTEVNKVSKDWVRASMTKVDELWVPSQAGKAPFVDAGVDADRIYIVHEPTDTLLFNRNFTAAMNLEDHRTISQLRTEAPVSHVGGDAQQGKEPRKGESRDPAEKEEEKNRKKTNEKRSQPQPQQQPEQPTTVETALSTPPFRFFSFAKWELRKGVDVLIRAFLEEFTIEDNVVLYLKTYLFNDWRPFDKNRIRQTIQREIDKIKKTSSAVKPNHATMEQIIILSGESDLKDSPGMYKAMDAFVLPTRGEGWGLPIMESMAMGLPTIATNWSGQTEFMTPVNSYLIPVEKLVPAGGGVDFKDRSMKWAQPSLEETKRLMRHVFTHREEAKKVGLRAEQDVHTLYTQDRIARQILERLANIMERHKLPGTADKFVENVRKNVKTMQDQAVLRRKKEEERRENLKKVQEFMRKKREAEKQVRDAAAVKKRQAEAQKRAEEQQQRERNAAEIDLAEEADSEASEELNDGAINEDAFSPAEEAGVAKDAEMRAKLLEN